MDVDLSDAVPWVRVWERSTDLPNLGWSSPIGPGWASLKKEGVTDSPKEVCTAEEEWEQSAVYSKILYSKIAKFD